MDETCTEGRADCAFGFDGFEEDEDESFPPVVGKLDGPSEDVARLCEGNKDGMMDETGTEGRDVCTFCLNGTEEDEDFRTVGDCDVIGTVGEIEIDVAKFLVMRTKIIDVMTGNNISKMVYMTYF